MEITFEVTLDYGEAGPDEGTPTPNEDDVGGFVAAGMQLANWTPPSVLRVARL